MLVNNPMGSRRRRRFYHRAGVMPVPGDLYKHDFTDPNLYRYEVEPVENLEEEDLQPTLRMLEGRIRHVNYLTITSLHTRLLDIMDSVIAMGEAEDRAQAEKKAAEEKVLKEKQNKEPKTPMSKEEPKAGPSGFQGEKE